MPIPKKKYIQLKAMYDFQRKVSYNKEKLKKAIDIMFDHPEVMFEDLWSKMKEDEMVDVPSDWVPKEDKLKIEGEE